MAFSKETIPTNFNPQDAEKRGIVEVDFRQHSARRPDGRIVALPDSIWILMAALNDREPVNRKELLTRYYYMKSKPGESGTPVYSSNHASVLVKQARDLLGKETIVNAGRGKGWILSGGEAKILSEKVPPIKKPIPDVKEKNFPSSVIMEEHAAIDNARPDDIKSFTTYYLNYREKVFRYISYRSNNRQVAEELTSQVFLKAWEHFNKFQQREDTSFRNWIFRIAHNSVVDFYRKATNNPQQLFDEITTSSFDDDKFSQRISQIDTNEMLNRLIRNLTELQQDVLRLKYIEGKSYKEIAIILQKSDVSVRAVCGRAVRKLRRTLAIKKS